MLSVPPVLRYPQCALAFTADHGNQALALQGVPTHGAAKRQGSPSSSEPTAASAASAAGWLQGLWRPAVHQSGLWMPLQACTAAVSGGRRRDQGDARPRIAKPPKAFHCSAPPPLPLNAHTQIACQTLAAARRASQPLELRLAAGLPFLAARSSFDHIHMSAELALGRAGGLQAGAGSSASTAAVTATAPTTMSAGLMALTGDQWRGRSPPRRSTPPPYHRAPAAGAGRRAAALARSLAPPAEPRLHAGCLSATACTFDAAIRAIHTQLNAQSPPMQAHDHRRCRRRRRQPNALPGRATHPAALVACPHAVGGPVIGAVVIFFAIYMVWKRVDHRSWRGHPIPQPAPRKAGACSWALEPQGSARCGLKCLPRCKMLDLDEAHMELLCAACCPCCPPASTHRLPHATGRPIASHVHPPPARIQPPPPHAARFHPAVVLIAEPKSVKIPVVIVQPDRALDVGYPFAPRHARSASSGSCGSEGSLDYR